MSLQVPHPVLRYISVYTASGSSHVFHRGTITSHTHTNHGSGSPAATSASIPLPHTGAVPKDTGLAAKPRHRLPVRNPLLRPHHQRALGSYTGNRRSRPTPAWTCRSLLSWQHLSCLQGVHSRTENNSLPHLWLNRVFT